MFRYACFRRPAPRDWLRYEYVVQHGSHRFAEAFEIVESQLDDPIVDIRAWWDAECTRRLWARIEREAPEVHRMAITGRVINERPPTPRLEPADTSMGPWSQRADKVEARRKRG